MVQPVSNSRFLLSGRSPHPRTAVRRRMSRPSTAVLRGLLFLYAFLVSFEMLWELVFGFDTIFKPYRIVGLLAVVTYILGNKRNLSLDVFDKCIFALIMLGFATAALWRLVASDGDLGLAAHETILFLFGFFTYIVVKQEARDGQTRARLMRALVMGTVASILLGTLLVSATTGGRFSAFYSNPNSLAVAVGASLHIIVARFLYSRTRGHRIGLILDGVFIVLLLWTMLFTGARGPIIALVVSLLFLGVPYVLRRSARSSRQLARVAAIIPVLVIGALVVTTAYERHAEESTAIARYDPEIASQGSGRWDIWRGAVAFSMDHYFLGAGTGQYRLHHLEYMKKLDVLYTPSIAEHSVGTHNEYLDVLTSSGFVGLILFLFVFVYAYRCLWRRFSQGDEHVTHVTAACLAILVFVSITAGVDNLFVNPQFLLLMSFITLETIRPCTVRAS